jgi:hypothetical protein
VMQKKPERLSITSSFSCLSLFRLINNKDNALFPGKSKKMKKSPL